ncbi:hypothetical protein BDK51DRAFT_32970, partial [Blyttiomyces helicus]
MTYRFLRLWPSLPRSTDFVVPSADILVGGTNDALDIEDLTSTQTASLRVLRFKRFLNTGDPRDIVIAPGVMPLLFAHGNVPQLGYHGPGSRTHASLDFFNGGGQVIIILSTGSGTTQLKILHGVTMALACGILYPTGIFIARFWHDARWLSLHEVLMNLASGNILVAAATAIIGTYGDMTFTHSKIGITVASLVFISTATGVIVKKFHTRFPLEWSMRVRKVHTYAGYGAYLLGVTNGFIGVLDLSGNDWSLAYAYVGYIVTVLTALSGVLRFSKTSAYKAVDEERLSRSYFVVPADHSPLFTWQEIAFRSRAGAKWIVIENSVYDVEEFIDRHPGGPGLISSLIGEDATDFFQGQTLQFTHSRLARAMLKDMAVGRVALGSSSTAKTADIGESENQVARNSILATHNMGSTDDEEMNLPLSKQTIALDPNEFRSLTILTRESLSAARIARPVWKLRLAFQKPSDSIIVRPGDHVELMFTKPGGRTVVREYTPINSVNTGYMDLIVKMISGPMTSHLLKCATIAVKGPRRRVMCLNPRSMTGCWNKVGMIAGGSGVTPMLLMIDYHLRNAPRTPSGDAAVELSLLQVFHKEYDRFGIALLNAVEREARGALR